MYVYSIFILNYEVNMKFIHIRYVLKMPVSYPFNGTAHLIPFLFISRSLSVKNPLVFLSTFIRSPCIFPSCFKYASYSFHLLHVAVYYFYSLLKSAHAGQQFACGRKKDASLSACVTQLYSIAHFLFLLQFF